MSDDEADPELLELLRKSLGITPKSDEITSDTKVLEDAEYIYGNSVDVAISMAGTKAAASMIWEQMQLQSYSTQTWSEHDLHPKAKDEATVNFIFVMDLLNFSFWSERTEEERFSIEYKDKRWTGYWSLVACLQRALEEGQFCRMFQGTFLYFITQDCSNNCFCVRCEFIILTSTQTFPLPLLRSMQMKKNAQTRNLHMCSVRRRKSRYHCSSSG